MFVNSNNPYCVEERRIDQLLVILSNCSFEELNADFMANRCPRLLEFLAMCVHCHDETTTTIRTHALDILANICRKLDLTRLHTPTHLTLLLSCTIGHLIALPTASAGGGSVEVARGLEMLAKLASLHSVEQELHSAKTNEQVLVRFEGGAWIARALASIEQALVLAAGADVLVVTHALECLYALSAHSEAVCSRLVVERPHLVAQLVNMLSVNAGTAFGASLAACKLVASTNAAATLANSANSLNQQRVSVHFTTKYYNLQSYNLFVKKSAKNALMKFYIV